MTKRGTEREELNPTPDGRLAAFWLSPADSLHPPETICATFGDGFTPSNLQYFRTNGGGPKYLKRGRSVLYRKSDLLAWICGSGQEASNTSQYNEEKQA